MADGGGRAVLAGARKGKERGCFIGPTTRRGGFARASWPTGATAWHGGGWRRAVELRPMEEGGARGGMCAAAVWHRPRAGGMSRPVGTQCSRSPDQTGGRGSAPACTPGGTVATPTWHVAARRRAWTRPDSKTFQCGRV
jgi:hypothetical protein